jgi:excisionase family DNA binding protein
VKELSEIINVKEKTLYQWVELRQIPFVRLNGSIRFNPDKILAWIENNSKSPSTGYNRPAQTAKDPRKGG